MAGDVLGPGGDEQLRAAAGGLFVTSIDIGALVSNRVIYPGACYLLGWSIREASGTAAAAVEIRDGDSHTSNMLASIGLAIAASTSQFIGEGGLPVRSGLFAHWISGAMVGAFWIGWPGPTPALMGQA